MQAFPHDIELFFFHNFWSDYPDINLNYKQVNLGWGCHFFACDTIPVWEHSTNDQTGSVKPSPQSVAFSSLLSEQSLIMLQVLDCEMHSGWPSLHVNLSSSHSHLASKIWNWWFKICNCKGKITSHHTSPCFHHCHHDIHYVHHRPMNLECKRVCDWCNWKCLPSMISHLEYER